MTLPVFISIPHGSLHIPEEVKNFFILSKEDVLKDSDEQTEEIYSCLKKHVLGHASADVARAVVDLNRAPDDIGGDGVIKTKTCYDMQVYNNFPGKQSLLVQNINILKFII